MRSKRLHDGTLNNCCWPNGTTRPLTADETDCFALRSMSDADINGAFAQRAEAPAFGLPRRGSASEPLPVTRMMVHMRPAPARQVACLLALGELHGLLEGLLEIVLGERAADAAPHEIRPQELAERRGVLGESADAAQLARDAAERIILEARDLAGNIVEIAPAPGGVVGMHPAAIIEVDPEFVLGQRPQIHHGG